MSADIIAGLHRLERLVLPTLLNESNPSEIMTKSKLQEVEVIRGLHWLRDKKLLSLKEELTEVIELDSNGIAYKNEGLPEIRFLQALKEGSKSFQDIKLSKDEIGVSIGILKKKNMIKVIQNNGLKFEITDIGKIAIEKQTDEQKFINALPLEASSLSIDQKKAYEILAQRKSILKLSVKKQISVTLTSLGKTIAKSPKLKEAAVDRLTPEMIKSGNWQNLRSYNVKSQVPTIFYGKKQPYRRFLDNVRTKLVALGFTEMTGPIVESEFWDMDALFMPQFHSARDIHDAYYIKNPTHTKNLPNEIVENVKNAHEKGIKGSKGWHYNFSMEKTSRLILRSHDTSISPRTLSSEKLSIPGKYFQIARCFRYDVIDATHNADFDQIGGFVVDKNLNLKHLFGLLRLFAIEFCNTDKIKVVPSYFPFTEPSVGLYAKHPQMGWIELAGAGIFRPEMTSPLGVHEKVIAWGIGLGRVAMFNLGINDIRQLYSHDLKYLREARI